MFCAKLAYIYNPAKLLRAKRHSPLFYDRLLEFVTKSLMAYLKCS